MEKIYVVNKDILSELDAEFNTHGVANCIGAKQEMWHKLMEDGFFAERTNAEKNENYRQIIPYTLIKNHENKYLLYKRTNAGGEDRLYNQHSIGMGGHINPIDVVCCGGQSVVSMSMNISRELEEEIPYLGSIDYDYDLQRVAMICLSETEVDRVHLGVVHVCNIDNTMRNDISSYKTEDAIELVGWHTIDELIQKMNEINIEPWTQRLLWSAKDGLLSL